MDCLWSASIEECFRPSVRDVLAHYTHPFPSRDGNRRSFIEVSDLKRIPQNGVAPFRMESQDMMEINWTKLSSKVLVTFIGKC